MSVRDNCTVVHVFLVDESKHLLVERFKTFKMSEFKCLKQDCKSFGHLFASNSRLQRHVRRMHDKAANVNCDELKCSYSTSVSSNLKRHKATHLRCATCHVTFESALLCNQHACAEVDLFVNVEKFRIHYSFLLFRSVFFAMNLDAAIPPQIRAILKSTKQRMWLVIHV